MKALLPHQQRVVDERAELEDRRLKLVAFIGSDRHWAAVPEAEQDRLIRQHAVMAELIDILDERIEAF